MKIRALTVINIQNQRITRIPFTGEFYEAFRQPQNRGRWFIWGESTSGKSSFTMQLAKEFARHEKVVYNMLEEDVDETDFIERTEYLGMNEVKKNFFTVQVSQQDDFTAYLKKRNSSKVIVIDSATYFFESTERYFEFRNTFKDKILIITGHAQGKHPRSEFEKSLKFDARQKIFVEAYLAQCKGRTIGPNGGRYIIWQEGYEKARGAGITNKVQL